MTWPEFLKKIEKQVALVGPLAARARPLVMPTIFVDGGSDFLKKSVELSSRELPTNRHAMTNATSANAAGIARPARRRRAGVIFTVPHRR